MLKEFKEFAIKGNAVDLAVGVIIGAAFGKIVTSLVEDIIMPIVGKATGGLDFTNMYLPLSDKDTPGLALADARKAWRSRWHGATSSQSSSISSSSRFAFSW